MQNDSYGAHEVIELHEVLDTTINAINTLQLIFPYAKEHELRQMMTTHLQFITGEYNNMVNVAHGLGTGTSVPYRPLSHLPQMSSYTTPVYNMPNAHPNQIDDHDVAGAMLCAHKAGAKLKMSAALEAANPQIRNMLLQGSVNCANQAYDVWGYMQRRGYYPLATLQDTTSAQLLRGYQPMTGGSSPVSPTYMNQPISPATTTPSDTTFSNSVSSSYESGLMDESVVYHESLQSQAEDALNGLMAQTELRPAGRQSSRKKSVQSPIENNLQG